MKPVMVLLTPKNPETKEHHTIFVYKDGRVVCSCLANLWNRDRDYASHCSHSQKLVEDFPDLSGYTIIKEN